MSLRGGESRRVAAKLRSVGVDVDSVFDLVNSRRSYRQAIPVLLEVLPTVKDSWVKEGVVRALAVKEAAGEAVARAMIREFEAIDGSDPAEEQALKWAISNTLSITAASSVFEGIARLASDRRHGRAREMLAVALGNTGDPRAVDLLVELLDDEEMAGHALIGLGNLRAVEAKPAIERFLDHPKPWVRREAERALKRIEKRSVSSNSRG